MVPKCLPGVTGKRRYLGGVSKFLGFLLGVAVALAGPAVFGVLAAQGGIELNTKEMALAFGIGALIFWAVVSYFSGAAALGAFIAFGVQIYCWLWIPNRTTNFLNDVPGVTTGMIDGSKQYTLNGVVPILAVISLVYGIQLIVRSVQQRRRERAEDERLQREQEAVQAQQEADAAALYPVAGSTYPEAGQYGVSYGNRSRFDDLFDEEPEPVRPRNQADDQTAQYPTATAEHTGAFLEEDAEGNDLDEETVLVPTDADQTVQVPTTPPAQSQDPDATQLAPRVEPDADEDATQVAPQVQPDAAAAQGAPAPRAPEKNQEAQAAKAPEATPEPDPDATQVAPQVQPKARAEARAEAVPDAAQQAPAPEPPQAPEKQEAAQAVKAPEVEAQPGPVAAPEVKAAPAPASSPAPTPAPSPPPSPASEVKASSAPSQVEDVAPEVKAEPAPTPTPAPSPAPGSGSEEQKAPRVEMRQAPVPAFKEQVGSQYRERMEDPEDTGEIHLTAFENPVVRPAGA